MSTHQNRYRSQSSILFPKWASPWHSSQLTFSWLKHRIRLSSVRQSSSSRHLSHPSGSLLLISTLQNLEISRILNCPNYLNKIKKFWKNSPASVLTSQGAEWSRKGLRTSSLVKAPLSVRWSIKSFRSSTRRPAISLATTCVSVSSRSAPRTSLRD